MFAVFIQDAPAAEGTIAKSHSMIPPRSTSFKVIGAMAHQATREIDDRPSTKLRQS
jgi:hypothetical protein